MIARKTPINGVGLCGFALLATLVVVRDWPFWPRMAAGVLLFAGAVVAAVFAFRRRAPLLRSIALALTAAAVGSGLLTLHLARQEAVLATLPDQPVAVTATVRDLPTYDGRYHYELAVTALDGAPVSEIRAELISRKALDCDLGDVVSGSMTLTPRAERADGTFARASAQGPLTVTGQTAGLRYWLTRLRGNLLARMDEMFDGDVRGVVKGVLLGDTVTMSEDLSAAFRACGLSHTVVVSGMHLTVVSGVFLLLISLLTGFRRRLGAALSLLPTLGFLALTGFAPSATRATVAVVIWLVGFFFDEDADTYASLGWAVILMALVDPVWPTQPGFLLSVGAVLGLRLCVRRGSRWCERHYYRRFRRSIPKPLTALIRILLATLGAQLGTLPLLMLWFSRLSAVGLVANLITHFAVDWLLIFGVLGLLALAMRLDPVGYALCAVAGLCARYVVAVVRWVARLPIATLPVWGVATAIGALLAVAALMIAVACRRTRLGALLCAALLLLSGVGNTVVSHWAVTVVVTESGCFVRDPKGGLSLVGFDDAYAGAYDAERIATALGAQEYGVVVWDDFSSWNALFRARTAQALVTDRPVPGAPQAAQTLSGPATLSFHEITFERAESATLVRIGSVALAVADGPRDALPEADLWVRPQPYGQPDAPRLIDKRGLASGVGDVYNESECDYILTIWPNGHIFIEKG